VTSVRSNDGGYNVTTETPQDTLMAIFGTARANDATADEVSMTRATLEDVFLKITGRSIRE